MNEEINIPMIAFECECPSCWNRYFDQKPLSEWHGDEIKLNRSLCNFCKEKYSSFEMLDRQIGALDFDSLKYFRSNCGIERLNKFENVLKSMLREIKSIKENN